MTIDVSKEATVLHGDFIMAAATQAKADAGNAANAAVTGKAWGCLFFNLVRVHNYAANELIEAARVAMAIDLLEGDAKAVVRRRFNNWKKDISRVDGSWSALDQTTRDGLLAGSMSFTTVYQKLLADEREATKAAKDKAAKAANAAAADPAALTLIGGETTQPEAQGFDVVDAIETLTLAFDEMDAAQMAAIQETFAAMVNAYDARVNALIDATDVAKAA